jgi:type II secretory pathway pseudopilin PulG
MRKHPHRGERGYAMAALLVTLGVMSVVLGMAMPVWRTVVQREKEEELIFRGRQYARAVQLYQRKFAAAYPASIDLLVEQKFLRKKYRDPITNNGEFEIIYQGTLAQRQAAAAGRGVSSSGAQTAAGRGAASPGLQAGGTRGGSPGQTVTGPGSAFGSQATGPQGGVVGVASKSKEKSIRVFDGRTVYSEWQFVWVPAQTTRTGPAGSVGPGGRGVQPGTAQPGAPRGRGPGGATSPFSRPPG